MGEHQRSVDIDQTAAAGDGGQAGIIGGDPGIEENAATVAGVESKQGVAAQGEGGTDDDVAGIGAGSR